MNARTPQDVVTQVQAAINEGPTQQEIRDRYGVTKWTIARLKHRGEITTRPSPRRQRAEKSIDGGRKIPRWVSSDYRVDFMDNVRLWGLDHALRLARRANAEAARAEV